MNIVTTFNNNQMTNKYWVAGKVITNVKAGATDVYLVCQDRMSFIELKEAIDSLARLDSGYRAAVVAHNTQLHYCEEESMESLAYTELPAQSILATFKVFTHSLLKQIAILNNLNKPAFIATVNAMAKQIPDSVKVEFN